MSANSEGTAPISRPKKSLSCPAKIPTAIPKVNPTVIVLGINLIRLPKCNSPITIIMIPDKNVATIRPLVPYCAIIP